MTSGGKVGKYEEQCPRRPLSSRSHVFRAEAPCPALGPRSSGLSRDLGINASTASAKRGQMLKSFSELYALVPDQPRYRVECAPPSLASGEPQAEVSRADSTPSLRRSIAPRGAHTGARPNRNTLFLMVAAIRGARKRVARAAHTLFMCFCALSLSTRGTPRSSGKGCVNNETSIRRPLLRALLAYSRYSAPHCLT